jgi:deoxyribose-phosphate aldolase
MQKEIANLIDNTLLRPEISKRDIVEFCSQSSGKGFATLCVSPCWVKICSDMSADKISTVAGFPQGTSNTETKLFEVDRALEDGASEIDMVMNVGRFKSREYKFVQDEITKVVNRCRDKIVKVIIEAGLLTEVEIMKASLIIVDAGAHFVKTCTGFGPRGTTVEDVVAIKKAVGDKAGIKASGGIRTSADCQKMLEAGATRIGTSNGLAILRDPGEAN